VTDNLFNLPSPIELIRLDQNNVAGIKFWVKRDDLIHDEISGNKWRKLKYNIEQAKFKGKGTLLTFGGAFSNHIAATAAAARIFDMQSIGVIRGEDADLENPTLSKAQRDGMKIHRITREAYRNKNNWEFISELKAMFGDFYLIPEGGSNFYGVQGSMEIMNEIPDTIDRIFVACGTGTTLAGMAINNRNQIRITGVSALKGDFLMQEVEKKVAEIIGDPETEKSLIDKVEVLNEYHFGGYAKTTSELKSFMQSFHQKTGVELDKIYTAKTAYAMIDQAIQLKVSKGENWLLLHTGGLQGNQE
jgi:1-aminocyclopropane-1-carboxylate deaminase/D-cysteine desulfhydrase-like pyridoxal-dependent ACC family enzyme